MRARGPHQRPDRTTDTLRRRLLDRALNTYENEGAAPTWRAGTLGTVGLTVPKPRLSVFNEEAFAESVLRIAGEGAVEAVVRVKPNVKDALLSAAEAVDVETVVTSDGELLAGVTAQARLPYLNVRLSKEAQGPAAGQAGR